MQCSFPASAATPLGGASIFRACERPGEIGCAVTMDRSPAHEPTAPAAIELTGSDRRHLRRLAHPLDPVVQIGAAGVTPGVLSALDGALRDHELVKVRITRERDERGEIAAAIAEQTRNAVAG